MRITLTFMAVALMITGCVTPSGVTYRNSPPESGVSDLLKADDASLHIVFLHGMGATGSGASFSFREALCARIPDCVGPAAVQTARIPLERQDYSYMSAAVWQSEAEWQASRPIVHRYVYANGALPPVVVEEVNWWPLLLPLKCRYLLLGDAPLTGVSEEHLQVCSAQGKFADDEHYPWLTKTQAQDVATGAGVTGGGALLNKFLKTKIMNWGLSDAVIATGPMADLIGRGIGASFAWAATEPGPANAPPLSQSARFVVVAESLGSFVAFDYYERHHDEAVGLTSVTSQTAPDSAKAAYGFIQVLDSSDQLYFLANQVALLELARLSPSPVNQVADLQEPSSARGLRRWVERPQTDSGSSLLGAQPNYRQVVGFHDPNDILTFEVPADLGGAKVHNILLANGPTYLGVFADPAQAHTAHARNSCVLDIIFDRKARGACRVASAK